MALPPKGDPRRSLRLAVISMRFVALFELIMAVGLFLTLIGSSFFAALILLSILATPGIFYLVLAERIEAYRFWALITSICLTSLAFVVAFFALCSFIHDLVLSLMTPGGFDDPIGGIVFAIVWPTLTTGLGMALWYSIKSVNVVKEAQHRSAGFEPVMAIPIEPDSTQS